MDLRFFVILHEYLLLLSASALACDLESSHGSCESCLAVYILAFAFFEADTFFCSFFRKLSTLDVDIFRSFYEVTY